MSVGVTLLVSLAVGAYAQAPLPPDFFCGQFNTSQCEPCINARQPNPHGPDTVCFYCAADQTCQHLTENSTFPIGGLPCPNFEYYVGSCATEAKNLLPPGKFCGQYSGEHCEPCVNARRPNPDGPDTVCFYCADDQTCQNYTDAEEVGGFRCPRYEYYVGTCKATALLPPRDFCSQFNGSQCEPCVNARRPNPDGPDTVCFYCADDQTCQHYTDAEEVGGFRCPRYEYYVSTCSATALLPPRDFCSHFNGTQCEACVNARQRDPSGTDTTCFYCASDKTCRPFTKDTVFGLPCPDYEYNVGTCTLTAKAIAILIGVFIVLFVIMAIGGVCCCCICCCIFCARRRKRMRVIEETVHLEEKDSIRQASADRRQERNVRYYDEIRHKYGLSQDDQEEVHDQLLVNEA